MPDVAKANTIVFVSDNHAQAAAGCYGEAAIETPAIDSLARRGKRFANAYTNSPLCCPARAAIATGRYPHQTGYFDNVLAYDGRTPSWMHRVRAASRQVVSVGKLHFRSDEDDNGFSEERIPMHILNRRGGTSMLLRAAGGEPQAIGQWELYVEQSGIGASSYQQYDRDITRSAIEWLRAQASRPQQEPWILFVSFASPHPPFRIPPHIDARLSLERMRLPAAFRPSERSEHPAIVHLRQIMGTRQIDDEDLLRRIRKAYYGLIMHVDNQIGEILGELEALDLGNPRLIYTSDHGEMLGTNGVFGKSCVYEGAIRVPMIICGDGIESGAVETAPVSHVDLFPTLLESVGVAPDPQDAGLPGRSLLQELPADRILFAEYHATGTTGAASVLRHGNYKLISHIGHPDELFDLERDPDETRNLAARAEHAERLGELGRLLRTVCDPVAADRNAKRAQAEKVEEFGGRDALMRAGALVFTPPPGKKAELREIQPSSTA